MKQRLKSLLRPYYHLARSLVLYPYSLKIASDYKTHYLEAQETFKTQGDGRRIRSLAEVRARVIHPATTGELIEFPDNYLDLIHRIAQDVDEKFKFPQNCRFFPRVDASPLPKKSEDIPALKNGDVISLQLKPYLEVSGLAELSAALMPQLEKKVFGSYLLVEKVYIYRSVVSRLEGQVSWAWHYDNHPKEIMKLMIYLTDVDKDSGPLLFLRSKDREPCWMSPKPLLGYSRVPQGVVERYQSEGYEPHPVIGPRGTLTLFNENIVHRATVAKSRIRDVVVFQIRPSTKQLTPTLDPRWTGSFEHRDFNPNPWDLRARPKGQMLSA